MALRRDWRHVPFTPAGTIRVRFGVPRPMGARVLTGEEAGPGPAVTLSREASMRKEGKTQAMLLEVLQAISEGEPQIVVVAHSQHYASDLGRRFKSMLERKRIGFYPAEPYELVVGASRVAFVGYEFSERPGYWEGWGPKKFYDHAVWENR